MTSALLLALLAAAPLCVRNKWNCPGRYPMKAAERLSEPTSLLKAIATNVRRSTTANNNGLYRIVPAAEISLGGLRHGDNWRARKRALAMEASRSKRAGATGGTDARRGNAYGERGLSEISDLYFQRSCSFSC